MFLRKAFSIVYYNPILSIFLKKSGIFENLLIVPLGLDVVISCHWIFSLRNWATDNNVV